MFRTKKDVDRYAQDVLRRVKNERERNMRCYNIAVQYFKVRDFESTRRYVCMYLAFKDDSASAHKLLGQALEGLKQKEKALAQYRRSVELEGNQPELILKICELITDQDVHLDTEKARYWCERAEDLFPHDPVVFRLKERLLTNGSTNNNANFSKEFEDLISSELKSRPVDVNVHVRQLKLYVDTGRTQAAYAHAQQIEAKKLFAHEIQWYDYLTTLYKTYYDKNLPEVADCEFFVNWTMVNERYVMLCLAENQNSPPKSITECGNAIYRFDEVLHKAYAMLSNSKSYGQVSLSVKRSADFLEHMSAQLCLHLATFIFKKAKNEQGNWNEATRSGSPLLLFALVLAQPSDEQNMGGTPLKLLEIEPLKINLPQWTNAAYHRHCQAGNVLISLAKDSRQQYIEKILHSCYKNWRERLFQKLFTFEETKNGLSTSHFVNHPMFSSPPRSDSSILRYLDDVIVQIPKQVAATATIHPGSLHHLVWLGVQGMRHSSPVPQRMPLPPHDFHTHQLFAALAISDCGGGTPTGNDTVNRLDVDSFLYAAVLCAGAQLCNEINSGFYSCDRPITLPADITCQLCTPEQANWWNAVHKIYSKQMTSRTIVDAKWDLLRGIEVIRAIGNHGLDPLLLAALAQTFTERAMSYYTSSLSSSSDYITPKLDPSSVHHNPEVAALESRANLYWKAALPLLERMRAGKAISNPTSRLFDFHRDQVDATTLATLIEEGNLFVARQLMANEEYEEAVEAFKLLRSPYASYHTAEVYLKLAADNNMVDSVMSLQTSMRDSMLKEKRSKQTALLEKARDALYVTRDRLHTDLQHPLHRVLQERIKFIESRLDDTEEFLSPTGSPLGPAAGDHSLRVGQAEMNGSANRSQRQLTYMSTSTPRSKAHNSPRSQALTQPSAPGPDIENLLQASETRLQDAFKLANNVMAERLESIVDTIMSKLTRLEVSVDEIRRDVAKLQNPDDLYMLGDDEDYSDDVLSFPASYVTPPSGGNAPSTAAAYFGAATAPNSAVTNAPPATHYGAPAATNSAAATNAAAYYGTPTATNSPAANSAAAYYGAPATNTAVPASRGVQGTATVTYGAPVVPPPVQSQPQYYTPPQYHHTQSPVAQAQQAAAAASIGYYGQGALPFSEGQQLPDFLRPATIVTKAQSPIPVNVVITSSDTLPTGPPPVLPTLSVTIPPKHRLGVLPTPPMGLPLMSAVIGAPLVAAASMDPMMGAAHEFQISMPPSANIPSLQNPPLVLQQNDDEELESRTVSPDVEHDPYPDFKPIIPLPDEVSLTTGEEDERVLFENRAKLYRFVDKEWKERGIGMLKLLEDKSTKKVRLLMRREQVHKICANHYLTKDMSLNPMPGSDKAWVWSANDFAEQKLQRESFCVKFKTADEASNFKDAFETAQLMLSDSANCSKDEEALLKTLTASDKVVATSSVTAPSMPAVTSTPPTSKITLGGFSFTSTPTMKQTEDKSDKAALATSKQPVPSTTSTPNPFTAFTFTPSPKVTAAAAATTTSTTPSGFNILKTPIFTTPTGPQLFLNKFATSVTTSSTPTASEAVSKGVVTSTTTKPSEAAAKGDILLKSALKSSGSTASGKTVQIVEDVKISDTKSATDTKSAPPKSQLRRPHKSIEELVSADSTPSFIEKSSGAVDFAALAKSAASSATSGGGFKKSETFKGFEGSGKLVFGGSKSTEGDEDSGATDDFVPTAEFKPVIPLPELIAVKTGEEEERVLFEQRAKLLRFDQSLKEWKERGIGKMKILHDPNNGTVRFLMRREQVLKVCCNHRITADFKIEMSSNSDRTWTWYALDYSEGSPTNELFALRFKTVEKAGDFKAAVEDALDLIAAGMGNTSLGLSDVSSDATNLSSSCAEGSSDEGAWPGPVKITEIHSTTTPITKSTKPQQSLSEMFKPKAGSWECSGCLVRNNADVKKCPACGTVKEGEASPKPQQSLSEMFKPKAGSWECSGCLVRNNADVKQCPACSTWKDGVVQDSTATSNSSSITLTFGSNVFATTPAPKSFSFGIPPSSTSTEAPKFLNTTSTTSTTNTSFSFGMPVTTQSSTAAPKVLFGNMFASNTPSAQSVVSNMFGELAKNSGEESSISITPAKQSVFGDVSSSKSQETGTIFGGVCSQSQSTPKSNLTFSFGSAATDSSPPAFVFQGQGDRVLDGSKKFEFNFSGVHSPKQPKSPGECGDTDGESDGEGHDESNDSIVFHPVIPLPDQVPVTTGEEDETALYTHRAKLFRFVDGEWKERGIGDVKILKHNKTGKLRLLMRREMILKVCLNHFLTTELNFQPKDDKTWLWCAIDYSDGEVAQEKFALRFKTADIASEFKDAVDKALADLEDNPVGADTSNNIEDSKSSATMNAFSFSLPNTQQTSPQSKSLFSFSFKGGIGSSSSSSAAQKSSIFGGTTAADGSQSDDDVQVVYETTVTPEEREAALKLQLPPTFYAYKQAPPCPGCVGCDPEDRKSEPVRSQSDVESPKPTTQKPFNKFSPLAAPVLFGSLPKAVLSSDEEVSDPSGFAFQYNFSTAFPLLIPDPKDIRFGATPSGGFESGALFGKTQNATSTSTTAEPSTNLFWSGAPFGKTPSATASTTSEPSAGPVFGSAPLFGKSPSATSTSTTSEPSATPIFGSSALFGKSASVSLTSSTWNVGTTAPATGMLFGAAAGSSPSNNNQEDKNVIVATTTAQSNNNNGGPGFLFKDAVSFSSLASNTGGSGLKTAPENFKLDSVQPVFGGLKTTPKSTKTKEKTGDEENEVDEEGGGEEEGVVHSEDIHFEPVVPMPPLIEVKTGEEDESKLFYERAKLYRYDSELKEWKERGVGEMKILFHPTRETYRLLMRREQVHKVVCNHLITKDLELAPMATSNMAYMWVAMNLSEEYSEPQLEKLAVRFKNVELAQSFKAKMEECLAQVKLIKAKQLTSARADEILNRSSNGQDSSPAVNESPATVQRVVPSYERVEEDDYEVDEDDYDEEEEDDDDDDDDDDDEDDDDNTIEDVH